MMKPGHEESKKEHRGKQENKEENKTHEGSKNDIKEEKLDIFVEKNRA